MKISNVCKCIFFSTIFIISILCNDIFAIDINSIEKVDKINVLDYEKESSSYNMSNINLIASKSLLAGKTAILDKYDLKDIDILKVGHHGSKTSTSNKFIDKINPKYSIISVGKNNRYGHPK